MTKRRSSESGPEERVLFADLSATEALEHHESIAAPLDDSLARILDDVRRSRVCGACKEGMPIIFGAGPAPAQLMVIGEGPGIDDIQSEQPFQGQAGQLLARMLAAINVTRAECYICNVIKCIPPARRIFKVEEIEDCRPFLLRQILVVNPRVIITFGALAAQTLLRSKKNISELRGRCYRLHLNGREIAVIPSFNPAYLLRVPEKKREAWEDLKLVRELLHHEGHQEQGKGKGPSLS
jgi:DNA polymerase